MTVIYVGRSGYYYDKSLRDEFKKPEGYVFSSAGSAENRSLSFMCNRRDIDYFIAKTFYGRIDGYFYPQSIIDEYDKKHGTEDQNKGII